MSNKAFETILEHKIVAIVRGFEPETVVEMAKAYEDLDKYMETKEAERTAQNAAA